MTKIMQKSVILTVVFGLLLVAAATPSAMAQDRCRRRGVTSSRYYNNNYRNDYRRDRYRYDYDNQATTGKAVGRTAAGAGIGAVAGALLGGGKGAAVGAVIGGAGGYIYHQQKVNNQRDRWYRR
ncbi:MAG TPA: YMGG-like glycine zipper-containing protein [Blastocatellia bacterium]|jgi:hypothetical protein|nr:YMGG-like glycine zipper-containing protein [Blastocatellia bacterium]